MVLAFLDCPTGLAGDMLLAALLDLGLPEPAIHRPLAQLGLEGRYRLHHQDGRSGGLRGRRLTVETLEADSPHRSWGSLRQTIATSALEPPLRERVLAVFSLLAEVEGTVHGHAPEQVYFHEVGALDALVDVVGVCAGLLHFEVDRLICGSPPAGHGSVDTAHGRLPLPAPAVLELASRCLVPLASAEGFPPGELTTPTGLALMACWADRFGVAPALVPSRVGIGLGHRELDRPNLLRLWLATPSPESDSRSGPALETVLQQQAQIDDATPEDLAFVVEELRRAGALEVFTAAIQMKKGRLGVLLTALAWPDQAGALREVWWRHGTSLGVREQLQHRWALPRRTLSLSTDLGMVRLKQAGVPGGPPRYKAEHDDLAALARRHGLSLAEVRMAVDDALAKDNALAPPESG
ncbi:LarC family nickel insertion protein [Synechococcus sp. BSF8S]|uniref:LarC family nickel insertion protein n=1 Tax=Synechococcales TaxID=1890424 RepID=UPI0016262AB2|nr:MULTISPECIES: LarC family nickel insertion protein [unclassified Synechococcus]MBC1260097.1 LarC family nickel insertion protein [Synechococcus sp. BSF8S]MBC1263086.1 LarC family nickel insertion protein [Synechococcus sp. BSA11S]